MARPKNLKAGAQTELEVVTAVFQISCQKGSVLVRIISDDVVSAFGELTEGTEATFPLVNATKIVLSVDANGDADVTY